MVVRRCFSMPHVSCCYIVQRSDFERLHYSNELRTVEQRERVSPLVTNSASGDTSASKLFQRLDQLMEGSDEEKTNAFKLCRDSQPIVSDSWCFFFVWF